MRTKRSFTLTLLLLTACSTPPDTDDGAGELAGKSDDGRAVAAYVDLEEVLTGDDHERWFDLKRLLARDFDEVCGDTFCEGDYTNLAPLRLRCSAARDGGALRSCIWLFAGSHESVRPATGSIAVHARIFRCRLPLTGAPRAVLDALLGPGEDASIHRPLPGAGRSIYEALGECFE